MGGELLHYLLPLLAIVGFALFAAHHLFAIEVLMHLPSRIAVAAGHILPYEDAYLVAIGVPQLGFHFHVLAYHVKSPFFGLIEVIDKGFVARGCIQAVGPPSLVERTEIKQVGIVELHAHYAVGVALGAHLAHCHIALHLIHLFATRLQCHLHIVEEWAVGRPQLGIGGHCHHYGASVDALAFCHHLGAVEHAHLGHCALLASCGFHSEVDGVIIDVGCCLHALHMCSRHGFQPYSLPDACHLRIPYPLRIAHLLAAWLIAAVGAVVHAHIYHIFACGIERRCDVEAKCCVSACVAAYLDAVNPHIGSPIYRSEVEHHIAAFPRFWHRKTASIPQFLILSHAFAHTRETRFDAERHQYLAIVGARCGGSAIGDGILPQAIEVLPRIALHYWAWIFCPYIIHIDVFCPFGLDFVAGRCILRTHRRGYHRQHCQRCHQSFF